VKSVAAINSTSLHSHAGSNSAAGLGGFGAAVGDGNEPAVQALSRLLAIDKGEAVSGVEADEEIVNPD
jgi:hypothetical protein